MALRCSNGLRHCRVRGRETGLSRLRMQAWLSRLVLGACAAVFGAALLGASAEPAAPAVVSQRTEAWRVFAVQVSWKTTVTLRIGAGGGECRTTATATGAASFFAGTYPFPGNLADTWPDYDDPVRLGNDRTRLTWVADYEPPLIPATVRLVVGRFACDDPASDPGCSGSYSEKVVLRPSWTGAAGTRGARVGWELDAERLPTPSPPRSCLTWEGRAKLFGPLHEGGEVPLSRTQMFRSDSFGTSRSSTDRNVRLEAHAAFRIATSAASAPKRLAREQSASQVEASTGFGPLDRPILYSEFGFEVSSRARQHVVVQVSIECGRGVHSATFEKRFTARTPFRLWRKTPLRPAETCDVRLTVTAGSDVSQPIVAEIYGR